jgi:hypothetical protein
MKTYRVWVEIEEYDSEADEYEMIDVPFGCTATFDNLDAAIDFAMQLDQEEAL